ncbi:hypothetical protein PJL18_03134 [Paenarthrobacter nicotinovorans]|nr:hypothetical protein [Paenarthrobacter nicotinovorans]
MPVEVEDGKYRPVPERVDERWRFPGSLQRPGFSFPVADDAGNNQVRVVHCRTGGMHQRVAQLTALMNGSGRRRTDVAGDASRRRELPDQGPEPFQVSADGGVNLRVTAFQVGIGDDSGATVAGSGHHQDLGTRAADDAIEVSIDQG